MEMRPGPVFSSAALPVNGPAIVPKSPLAFAPIRADEATWTVPVVVDWPL